MKGSTAAAAVEWCQQAVVDSVSGEGVAAAHLYHAAPWTNHCSLHRLRAPLSSLPVFPPPFFALFFSSCSPSISSSPFKFEFTVPRGAAAARLWIVGTTVQQQDRGKEKEEITLNHLTMSPLTLSFLLLLCLSALAFPVLSSPASDNSEQAQQQKPQEQRDIAKQAQSAKEINTFDDLLSATAVPSSAPDEPDATDNSNDVDPCSWTPSSPSSQLTDDCPTCLDNQINSTQVCGW